MKATMGSRKGVRKSVRERQKRGKPKKVKRIERIWYKNFNFEEDPLFHE
jgi:hypothetical protein